MSQVQELRIDVNGSAVRAWIHRPDDSAACPAVLLCDESDYATTSRKTLTEEIVRSLTSVGVAAVTFHHRPMSVAEHTGEDIPSTAITADAIDDASAVFRAVITQQNIQLDRVGVLGIGAAAGIAACLAGRTADIARLCLVSPSQPDVAATASNITADKAASTQPVSNQLIAPAFDPAHEITRHDRPTLILHGAADRVTPPERGAVFAGALERPGHQVQHVLVGLGDHGFSTQASRAACVTMLMRFFSPLAGHS